MHAHQPMILVCGPSRSGTALVRSALNQHPDVHLAGETHYFDDLRVRLGNRAAAPLEPEQARIAADYFSALSHRPYGHGGEPGKGRVSPADLVAHAAAKGGTGDAFFLAYCELEAARAGKRIAGEKTPRHVFRLAEMLSVFPDARVICLTRDPRAIVASYRDWQNQGGFDFGQDPGHRDELQKESLRTQRSYHPATIAMLWRAQMNAAQTALQRFGPEHVYLCRYEALVDAPEQELQRLSQWLGLQFDPAMLDVPMHNSSYSKFEAARGVSREAVDRWAEKLSRSEIALVERVCGTLMESIGYPRLAASDWRSEAWLWAVWPGAVIRAMWANSARSGHLGSYLLRRLRLVLRG